MPSDPRPRVSALCPSWGGTDEAAWSVRQVLGALATAAKVTVITPAGSEPRSFSDGVFVVEEHATRSPTATLQAKLILGGFARSGHRLRDEATLRHRLQEPWSRALRGTAADPPDLVVTVDCLEPGATFAAGARWPGAPVVSMPLLISEELRGVAMVAEPLRHASAMIAFSAREAARVGELGARGGVLEVRLPLSDDPSALRQPHELVGSSDYMLVVATQCRAADRARASGLARLLLARFEARRIVVASRDRITLCMPEPQVAPAVTGGSDLRRLIAWASVTVDLSAPQVFGRRTLESFLYSTPVIVPSGTPGAEHARSGSGGLWFASTTELFGCVEALLEDGRRGTALGRQGYDYATAWVRPTGAFIQDILSFVSKASGMALVRNSRGGSGAQGREAAQSPIK
ncbi:MAG: hypothetical protein ACRDVP_07570 [Acidimicrobiales bacterium]